MAAKKPGPKKTGPKPVKALLLDSVEGEIIESITLGDGYRAIASKYKVSLGTFHKWIEANDERSHACARAREESARQCDEQAIDEIRAASDVFELAKAKEIAIHLRWRAKARCPKEFGDRQHIDINDVTSLTQEQVDAKLAILLAKANKQ